MAYSAMDGKTEAEIAAMRADKRAALAEARALAPKEPERPGDFIRATWQAKRDASNQTMRDIFARHRKAE